MNGNLSAVGVGPVLHNITLQNPALRLLALTHLASAIDAGDATVLDQLQRAGLTQETLVRLRDMPLAEACRLTLIPCGVSVTVEPTTVRSQIQRLDQDKADRAQLEYFVKSGASPTLISRLFALPHADARRLRSALAPQLARGGRPRAPTEHQASVIRTFWQRLPESESLRIRVRQLHEHMISLADELPIAALEMVVLPQFSPVTLQLIP